MTATKRKDLMRRFAEQAHRADNYGYVNLRRNASDQWRGIATTAEASRAPKYLTWTGRVLR